MLSIRRASEADCALIRRLAGEVFPATYREILAPAQLDYMMEWMYSEESLQGQFRAGHVWFIASSDGEPCGYVSVERQGEDLFLLQKIYVLPRFQGLGAGEFLFRRAVEYIRSVHSGPSTSTAVTARCISTNGWACAACARAISRSATVII